MEVFNEKPGAFGKGGAFVRGFFGKVELKSVDSCGEKRNLNLC